MSGSVVFILLVLFIAAIMLIAASCIFAYVRKRRILARLKTDAAEKSNNILFDADHPSEV